MLPLARNFMLGSMAMAALAVVRPDGLELITTTGCPCLKEHPPGVDPRNGVNTRGGLHYYPYDYGLAQCDTHDAGLPPSCNGSIATDATWWYAISPIRAHPKAETSAQLTDCLRLARCSATPNGATLTRTTATYLPARRPTSRSSRGSAMR